MKRNGFTLSELIVAIGIIGILAAITVPMLDNILPDQNKIKVLKYYKVIQEISQELVNDKSLYYSNDCIVLMCTQRPLNPEFNDQSFEGENKFANLFFEKMESTGDRIDELGDFVFKLADGSEWSIGLATYNFATNVWSWNQNNLNAFQIRIDIIGPEGANMDYGTYTMFTDSERELRRNTDQFYFAVNESGMVYPADELTRAYLLNPNKLNDKKRDFDCAANINACQAARQPAQ